MLTFQKHSRVTAYGWLPLLLAILLVTMESKATFIRIRPNTYKEFHSINCHGIYDKQQYSSLNKICDDCHNVFRDPEILLGCKFDCFHNSIFPRCVSMLLLNHKEPELSKMVYRVSGQKPLIYLLGNESTEMDQQRDDN